MTDDLAKRMEDIVVKMAINTSSLETISVKYNNKVKTKALTASERLGCIEEILKIK